MGRLQKNDRGQASVELLGALPALLIVLAMAWQLVLAGHTAWQTANAAKVAARAQAVGKDPIKAAKSALPGYLKEELVVKTTDKQGHRANVKVQVQVPLILHRWSMPLSVSSTAGPPQKPT